MTKQKEKLAYSDMVKGLEPNIITQLDNGKIKKEWKFDDYVIYQWVDGNTGELLKWGKLNRGKKQNGSSEIVHSDKPFVMLFDTAMIALEEKRIDFDEYAVLIAAGNLIDWHDYRYVVDRISGEKHTIRSFATAINRRYETIRNVMKSLESKGFIKLEVTGNATYILVNADIAYKGKLDKVTTNDIPNSSAEKGGKPQYTNTNKGFASRSQIDTLDTHKNAQSYTQKRAMTGNTNRVMTEIDAEFAYYENGGNNE